LETSIWTAGALAALAVFANHALEVPIQTPAWVLVFCTAMLVYNLDHLIDAVRAPRDRAAKGKLPIWALASLVAASSAATVVLLWSAPPAARWIFAGYGALGLVYGLPLIPTWRGRLVLVRLKDIPGLKAVAVSAGIALATFGLPVAFAGGVHLVDALAPVGFLFVFVFANTVVFDVRDLEEDAAAGVPSIPVALGLENTRTLLVGIGTAVLLTLVVVSLMSGVVAHPEMIFCLVITIGYVVIIDSSTPRSTFFLVVEGCAFLPAVLATIAHGSL